MPPTRKTAYLGSFGYNANPQELGEPSGFWQFASTLRYGKPLKPPKRSIWHSTHSENLPTAAL